MNAPTDYLAWFLGSALLVAALTPLARRLAHRIGMVDRPGGQIYKWHQHPTAYLGGVAIALVVALVVAVVLMTSLSGAGSTRALALTAILAGGLVCGAVGAWDDWKSLGVKAKVTPTLVGAVAVWGVGIRVGLTGVPVVDFLLTVAWIVVITHAINVIDNMDGVAVGLCALAALAVFTISVSTRQPEVALLAAAVAGACLGFLGFNFRPATVFLGDAGTLFLGFVLASLVLAVDLPGASRFTRGALPLLVMGVPIFNTAVVIVSRMRGGRRITVGGTDGVAHRLVARGLSRNQATVVFWVAGFVVGAGAFAAAELGGGLVLAVSISALVVGVTAFWLLQVHPLAFRAHYQHVSTPDA
jgi:UDP-GlcNAc:undecaprenyl-phosphate GlcNAc-1-phosphate transferase